MTESLAEFAASTSPRKKGTIPWLETLPEWPEILKAWQDGVPAVLIRRWLIEKKDYPAADASQNRVERLLREKYPRG